MPALAACRRTTHGGHGRAAVAQSGGGGISTPDLRLRKTPTDPPKILDLPDTVWINRPAQDTTQETDTTAA